MQKKFEGVFMLVEIGIAQADEWDKVVKSFNKHEPFYLHAYAKAFEKHGSGVPVLLHYQSGDYQAMNVVVRRDVADDKHFQGRLPENTYFDLSTPYGYGGFMSDENVRPEVFEAYNQFCIERNYICEFVRFNLFSNCQDVYDGDVETKMVNVVCDLTKDEEQIFNEFNSTARRCVRKGHKVGLELEVSNTLDGLESFLEIYYDTMDRNQAQDAYYFKRDFFETLHKISGHVHYFFAKLEGKVIGANLLLAGDEHAYCFLSGTHRDYLSYSPNYLMMSEMIYWSKRNGMKKFVLGGGYGADDNLLRFKRGFASEGLVDFYIGHKVFNPEKYEELVAIRANDSEFDVESAYFPKYRA